VDKQKLFPLSDREIEDFVKEQGWSNLALDEYIKEVKKLDIVEDGENLRILDRWTVSVKKDAAICVSKEFEEAILATTFATGGEWGGYILGKILFYGRMPIIICERPLILAQTRSGGSFDIPDDAIKKFALSDEYIEVYGTNGWRNVGWVHSHHTMGCFWSGTDTTTMKELLKEHNMEFVLSIVLAKKDKSLDKLFRLDYSSSMFGKAKDDLVEGIKDDFIYYEQAIGDIDSLSDEIKEQYKKVLDSTKIVETRPETAISPTVTRYYGADDEYWPGYSGQFAREYSSRITGNKRHLNVKDFFEFTSDHSHEMFELLSNLGKKSNKVKVKDIVAEMTPNMIIQALGFYLSTPARVKYYLMNYNNFAEVTKNFILQIEKRVKIDSTLLSGICLNHTDAWKSKIEDIIKEDHSVITTYIPSTTTVATYKPKKTWKDYFNEANCDARADIVAATIDYLGETRITEIADKLVDYLSFQIRGDEDKWVDNFAGLYTMFRSILDKIPEGDSKVEFENAYLSFMGEGFSNFFYDSHKNELQGVVNALPDELVKPFVSDFIVDFNTDEELEKLIADGKVPVYRKKFQCPICKNWWVTQEDVTKCKAQCEERKGKEAKETKQAPLQITQKITQGEVSGPIGLDRYISRKPIAWTSNERTICGMTNDYWNRDTVCNYCGSCNTNENNMLICESECDLLVESTSDDTMLSEGFFTCPDCRSIITDEVEAEDHFKLCRSRGLILDLMIRKHINTKTPHGELKRFVELMAAMYEGKNSAPPPLVAWMCKKIVDEKIMLVCEKCGMSFRENVFSDYELVDNIYDCFMHESSQCHIFNVNNYVNEIIRGMDWKTAAFHSVLYQCKYCGLKFLYDDNIREHERACAEDYTCAYCKKVYSNIRDRVVCEQSHEVNKYSDTSS
jgi:hypothetical protein